MFCLGNEQRSDKKKDKIKKLDHNNIKYTKDLFELKNSSKIATLFHIKVKY